MTDGPPRGGHVLVVVDDAGAAAVLREMLAELGHDATVCRDGPEALAAVRRVRPSAVLLDLRLPVIDGWELGRRLRLAFGLGIRIVVATGRPDVTAEEVAARIPGAVFLPKPFGLEDLAQALDVPRAEPP